MNNSDLDALTSMYQRAGVQYTEKVVNDDSSHSVRTVVVRAPVSGRMWTEHVFDIDGKLVTLFIKAEQ